MCITFNTIIYLCITALTMFKVIREEIYRLEVQVDLFWSKKTKQMLKIQENITETRSVTDNSEMDKKSENKPDNKMLRIRDC